MKFGKRLKMQIEQTLPEWRDKFLSYKDLKKRVKLVSSAVQEKSNKRQKIELLPTTFPNSISDSDESASASATAEESEFVELLNAEIDKFNAFFVEQEEEYIIRHKELQDRIDKLKSKSGPNMTPSKYNEEMIQLRKDIVNFHGEMVLLENYSALNYTGVAKILKKYDKRTGELLRHPFIQKVLQQPFFTTEQLSKLVKECEKTLHSLFPEHPYPLLAPHNANAEKSLEASPPRRNEFPSAVAEEQNGNVEKIYTSTVAALRTLREIRKGSSTYGVFSLPPLTIHLHGFTEESDNSIPSTSLSPSHSSSLIPVCPKS